MALEDKLDGKAFNEGTYVHSNIDTRLIICKMVIKLRQN